MKSRKFWEHHAIRSAKLGKNDYHQVMYVPGEFDENRVVAVYQGAHWKKPITWGCKRGSIPSLNKSMAKHGLKLVGIVRLKEYK